MAKFSRIIITSIFFLFSSQITTAQVNAVTFGKNRVQFKKFKWQYYHSENFNVYFYQNGQELAKYALQLAEKELKAMSGSLPALACKLNFSSNSS